MRWRGAALFCLGLAAALPLMAGNGAAPYDSLAEWGKALFFDTDLSANRTEACATCHDPAAGFVDPRDSAAGRMVSLGDDGASLGDRNAPTAAYAAFAPEFGRDAGGEWRGGQFHDGRAATLEAQAQGPFVNPVEMALPDAAAVVARVREDARNAATLDARLGPDATTDAAFGEIAAALAAFERTPEFAPFDSRYDRSLRGEIRLTDEEELGKLLFFSKQFTNCNLCHQLRATPGAPDETFSNYRYRNIGTPANPEVRRLNGSAPERIDHGLLENPGVDDPAADGRFKVPTLRNVAVTGPYMHNGVFADLETVIRFYNKYNSRKPEAQINPETGQPWGPPEVAANLALDELEAGPALDEQRIKALVAFLKTLTDERYEPLLATP